MNLYLDDDSVARALVKFLRDAGHQVTLPFDVGKSGANDPVHLATAVQRGCVLLSRNAKHYREIHDLIQVCGGRHAGILIIRFDGNRKHDMKPHEIAKAISKIEAAQVPVANQIITLNQWR